MGLGSDVVLVRREAERTPRELPMNRGIAGGQRAGFDRLQTEMKFSGSLLCGLELARSH